MPDRAGRDLEIAKSADRLTAVARRRSFCCNFVNENKSRQNSTNCNQPESSPTSRSRKDLAENTEDASAGVRDLKSFVLSGTCGFDPHPGHQNYSFPFN